MSSSLPAWPPTLTEEQQSHLLLLATTYAFSHGLTYLPPNPTFPPTSTISAPLSLFPTPFPRHLFDLVREIQPIYNALYARVALDWEFLDRVMGGSVAKVDDFQGELWRGWKGIRDELVQVGPCWRACLSLRGRIELIIAAAARSVPVGLSLARGRRWIARGQAGRV